MYTKFNLLFILALSLVGFAVCQDAGFGDDGSSAAVPMNENDQKGPLLGV
jgi:hypothetical protein